MPSTKKKKLSKRRDTDFDIENEVMNRIYGLEKKRTFFLFSEYAVILVIFAILSLSALFTLISLLNQSESFDVFALFTQDFGTIKRYFFDTMHTFYIELPKQYLFLTVLFLGLTILVGYLFLRQFPTLKRKLQSIRKYSHKYQ